MDGYTFPVIAGRWVVFNLTTQTYRTSNNQWSTDPNDAQIWSNYWNAWWCAGWWHSDGKMEVKEMKQ